ncbi:MAG: hypothetical protein C4297_13910 [Gemmataceae bacterium]
MEAMAQLLVSVRSVEEAEEAIAGGADWIDVKEPDRGALGRADRPIIERIIAQVGARRPTSVSLGELVCLQEPGPNGTCLVKIGLTGCRYFHWQGLLEKRWDLLGGPSRVVLTAYADCRRAGSPDVSQVLHFAVANRCAGLLVDTWLKDGRRLLDFCSVDDLCQWATACHEERLMLAVAGSLDCQSIPLVLTSRPDIVAVRGAACQGAARNGNVVRSAVRALADLVHAHA